MNKANTGALTAEKFDFSCPFEVVCDHSMAEYYPEIRRVVSVTANPLPDSKFLSGNTLEFGGSVEFSMMYIGEDGSLSVLSCTAEYSERAAIPEEIRGVGEVAVDVSCVDTSFRVTAPRRVTLRAKLRARLMSDKEVSVTEAVMEGEKPADMASARTVKTLRKSIPTAKRGFTTQSYSASAEWKWAPGVKLISCPGTVSVSEVKARSGAATVSGDVILRCLVFNEKGIYTVEKIKMPFEEIITCDGLMEGDMVCAYGAVASAAVSEDMEGSGAFKGEAEFDMTLKWMRPGECNILCDAYSTAWEIERECLDASAISPLCCTTSSLSVGGTGKRSRRGEAGEYLVAVDMVPVFESVTDDDGKAVFSGSLGVKAYVAGEGDVTLEEFSLPLKFETRSEIGAGEALWWGTASVCDASGRLEGEGISVNGELCVSVCAVRKNKVSPVTAVQLRKSEPRKTEEGELRVIYPDSNETLWDIAKSCGADIDGVERVNGASRTDTADFPVVIPIK